MKMKLGKLRGFNPKQRKPAWLERQRNYSAMMMQSGRVVLPSINQDAPAEVRQWLAKALMGK